MCNVCNNFYVYIEKVILCAILFSKSLCICFALKVVIEKYSEVYLK